MTTSLTAGESFGWFASCVGVLCTRDASFTHLLVMAYVSVRKPAVPLYQHADPQAKQRQTHKYYRYYNEFKKHIGKSCL